MRPGIELKLTPFQQACLDDLRDLAERRGLIESMEPAGSTETYVVVKLGSPEDVEVSAWVYPDECMLSHAGRSYYFEKPDFSTGDELRAAFIGAATDLLYGKEPANPGSSRINLFCGKRL